MFRAIVSACLVSWCLSFTHAAETGKSPELRWWKGNLHTHSLWSDGDDFPDMIVDWYKKQGYDFLAISDHNVLQQAERWIALGTNATRHLAHGKYLARFGADWVETREKVGKTEVRLKPLSEYAPLFQEAGKFLLIPSEEITDKYKALPIHMNATNLRDFVPPQGGNSVQEVMQKNVDAVAAQRVKTGQSMLLHLNHPNFEWGITAEDLARVKGEHFFEVYNGHPSVHNDGDHVHAGTDRLWDIALALRITSEKPEPLYGIGVDDSHHYHKQGEKMSNAGRGWIMVRTRFLTPESIIHAMEQGDFYASSGVILKDVKRSSDGLEVRIRSEFGVRYRTEFIGTRRGFDSQSEAVRDGQGKELPVTRKYSPQVGEILAQVEGSNPSYRLKGDELYVRARIISSKIKRNPGVPNEKEMAWTQPLFPGMH